MTDREPPPEELPSGSPVDAIEAALGVIPPRQQLPLPKWLGWFALSVVIGFIPWIIYLGMTLQGDQRTDDYDIAWLGFDSAMALVLLGLAVCALRRLTATGPVAAVASTMLLVDAWFDVVTTQGGNDLLLAILFAAFAEIPLAIICAWVAVNAERVRARAYRRLRSRWERAVEIARAAQSRPERAEP